MSKEGGEPPQDNNQSSIKKDDIYESGKHRQIIRIVTVMAYMFAVSSMGMTLSGYYLFIWHPPNPKLISHVRNPLRHVADSPMNLSPPLPMALKSSPIEEPSVLLKVLKSSEIIATSKPPNHDFETHPRAGVVGGILLKKLTKRNLTSDQVLTTTESNMESSLKSTPSEEPSTQANEEIISTTEFGVTVLNKLLERSTAVKIDEDENHAIKVGQFKSNTILGKILGVSRIPTINEDKIGTTLRQ